jgi:hypothetical protein
MINVFIIKSGKRDVSKLLQSLSFIPECKIVSVEGIFIEDTNQLDVSVFSPSAAKIHMGRDLSAGEVGCAMAHNNCRLQASKSKDFSLILEDDAEIPHPDLLATMIRKCIDQFDASKNIVVNLATHLPVEAARSSLDNHEVCFNRHLGASPLALAYIVTPKSSELLLKSNNPIQFTADWPPAKVEWWSTSTPLVYHGTLQGKSLISSKRGSYRAGENTVRKILRYSTLEYWFYRDFYNNYDEFLTKIWLPRIRGFITFRWGK